MSFQKTDVFLAVARRGHGKSFLADKIMRCYPRVVVFDTLNEYETDEENYVHGFEELVRKLMEFKRESRTNFFLVYVFNPDNRDSLPEFNEALRFIFFHADIFVVIEEVQLYATAHFMPQYLRNCLLTGRHRNIGLLFTTQRPGELHKTILSQCSYVFVGQLHEKNDLVYVASFLNIDASKIIELAPRRFFLFQPGKPIRQILNDLTNVVEKKTNLPDPSVT